MRLSHNTLKELLKLKRPFLAGFCLSSLVVLLIVYGMNLAIKFIDSSTISFVELVASFALIFFWYQDLEVTNYKKTLLKAFSTAFFFSALGSLIIQNFFEVPDDLPSVVQQLLILTTILSGIISVSSMNEETSDAANN